MYSILYFRRLFELGRSADFFEPKGAGRSFFGGHGRDGIKFVTRLGRVQNFLQAKTANGDFFQVGVGHGIY